MKEWSRKAVKNRIFFLAAGILVGASLTFSVMKISDNSTIAIVDGKAVTESDLYNAMDKKSGNATLDKLIDNIVIENSAKTYGISISEKEVDEELKRRISTEYHSENTFLESIKASNMTLEDAKEELRLSMLFDRIATKDIRLSEDEINKYYKNNKESFSVPETRRISQIVLKNEADANAVRDRILQGYDFAALAREKSIGADKDKGGDRGFIALGKQKSVPAEVEKSAFQLSKGEISPVIKSSDGFHIIKVTEIVEKYEPDFEAIKGVVELKAKLEKCKSFIDILNDLRKTSSIKIKDKRYIKDYNK